VKVAADYRGLRSLEADCLADGDVLLGDEGQVLDPARELRERVLTLQGKLVRELLDKRDELGDFRDEVGLAFEHRDRPDGLLTAMDDDPRTAPSVRSRADAFGTDDAALAQ